MARYVDGFVLPVPNKDLAAYRRMAQKAGKIWMEHGALEYLECAADDLSSVPTEAGMEAVKGVPPFAQSVRAKRGETVVFSWIVYKSRSHRDRVNAKVMKDPRITSMTGPMPDPTRMLYGGFKVLVDM